MSENEDRISRNRVDIYGISQKFSNYNYLINGNFMINQRNKSTYSSSTSKYVYTVDRWRFNKISNTTCTKLDTGVRISSSVYESGVVFGQILENPSLFSGKQMTFSLKYENLQGAVSIGIYDGEKALYSESTEKKEDSIKITKLIAEDCKSIICVINKQNEEDFSIDLLEAKLEIGMTATPFIPRLYAEELALCQRYFYGNIFYQGGAVAASTGSSLYAYLSLPVAMRTTPTITYDSATVVRGYGKNIAHSVVSSITVPGTYDNQLRLLVTLSSNNMTTNQIYAFANGRGTFDAEIY